MKMRKLILGLISLIILTGVIAGCQQETTPATPPGEATPEDRMKDEGGGTSAERAKE